MPELLQGIIGRSILAVTTLAKLAFGKIIAITGRVELNDQQKVVLVEPVVAELERNFVQVFTESDVAAATLGFDTVASQLTDLTLELLTSPTGNFPGGGVIAADFSEPIIVFPRIQQAAEDLASRGIVTRDRFDQLTRDARARAFTISNTAVIDTIDRVRDALRENVLAGASLDEFAKTLEASLETSKFGAGHTENVFRTNVQSAFHRAHKELADDPIVSEAFPYQAYIPIEDGRTRATHAMLGEMGLNSTNVYRKDDPFWELFTPPIDFQCRCGVQLLTLDAAAELGVREAMRWRRTGVPPQQPTFQLDLIPFRPNPEFVRR
jgi:hypothetical protein